MNTYRVTIFLFYFIFFAHNILYFHLLANEHSSFIVEAGEEYIRRKPPVPADYFYHENQAPHLPSPAYKKGQTTSKLRLDAPPFIPASLQADPLPPYINSPRPHIQQNPLLYSSQPPAYEHSSFIVTAGEKYIRIKPPVPADSFYHENQDPYLPSPAYKKEQTTSKLRIDAPPFIPASLKADPLPRYIKSPRPHIQQNPPLYSSQPPAYEKYKEQEAPPSYDSSQYLKSKKGLNATATPFELRGKSKNNDECDSSDVPNHTSALPNASKTNPLKKFSANWKKR